MNGERRRVPGRVGGRLAAALLAVAVLLSAWFAWRFAARDGGADVELPSQETVVAPPAIEGAPLAPESAESKGARSEVATPVAQGEAPLVVPDELAHPYLYVLVVRTLDEHGLPVRGAALHLAPVRARLNEVRAHAEIDGWTTIAWRGKEPETEVDVQIGEGFGGARRVRLAAGVPHELALLGDQEAAAVIRTSFRLVPVGFGDGNGGASGASFLLERSDPPMKIVMERFPHPHSRFGDLQLERMAAPVATPPPFEPTTEELTRLQEAVQRTTIHQSWTGSLGVITSFRYVRPVFEAQETSARVSAVVLDEAGAPVPDALVLLGRERDGGEHRSTSDGEGRVVFESVAAGWWEARAGGGMEGLARERLFVAAPTPLASTLRLSRGSSVRGRVENAEGRPHGGVLVRYESTPDARACASAVRVSLETAGGEEIAERGEPADRKPGTLRAPWVDQVVARADGSFEIPNLPPGLGRLVVVPAGDTAGGSLLVEEGVLPSDQEYVLRLPPTPGGLRLRVASPRIDGRAGADEPPAYLEVRAISLATGRGALLQGHPAPDGAREFHSPPLAAGAYRVEVGARSFGFHDLGVHLVADGTISDLGDFTQPPPARLELEGAADRKATFYLRRADLDLRVEPREAAGGSTFLLPAGSYWVFWRDGENRERRGGLTLEAGATARFALE